MQNQITMYTLVDITPTGVTRSSFGKDTKERNQHRNWETVLQVLGLKTQPIVIGKVRSETVANVEKFNEFGEMYTGEHTVWAFEFSDEKNIYQIDQLETDFEQVPIITDLNETARFLIPVFHPYGAIKNLYFKFNP